MKLNDLILITRAAQSCRLEHAYALGVGILAASTDTLRWHAKELDSPTINLLQEEDPTKSHRVIFQGSQYKEGRTLYSSWIDVPTGMFHPDFVVDVSIWCAEELSVRNRLTSLIWGEWRGREKRIPELHSELLAGLDEIEMPRERENKLLEMLGPYAEDLDPHYHLEGKLSQHTHLHALTGLTIALRQIIASMRTT